MRADQARAAGNERAFHFIPSDSASPRERLPGNFSALEARRNPGVRRKTCRRVRPATRRTNAASARRPRHTTSEQVHFEADLFCALQGLLAHAFRAPVDSSNTRRCSFFRPIR